MLTTELFDRSLSSSRSPAAFAVGYTSRLLRAIQPAPHVRFEGVTARQSLADRQAHPDNAPAADEQSSQVYLAHHAGTNALTVDSLVTGGADGAVSMWDLEAADLTRHSTHPADQPLASLVHKPLGSVQRNATTTTFGVTALSFYPFDSLAFLSSSYDHHLRVYSSETLQASASFDLSSVVYSHALSPIASHLLVACATQHPTIRLIDLRSGSGTHSLAGHGGAAVLGVAWSPREDNILASAGTDGAVRVWDIRKSASSLGVLDMDDSIGIAGYDGHGLGARRRERGRAHAASANGITWTEDGKHLVSTGHDERIRVWDMRTGANTLANFGPIVRNKNLSTIFPLLVPKDLVEPSGDVLFFPNEKEILMYELFEGRLIKRLRAPGIVQTNERIRGNQINALAWRPFHVQLLSAHGDGTVRSWEPRTSVDAFVDEQEAGLDAEELSDSRKRKREVLDEIYRDLTQPKVTYT